MRKFPLINFSLFSSADLCDFISERVHPEVERLLVILRRAVLDKEIELFNADVEPLFSLQLLQLEDKCNMLIRLEKLVLFPYIKSKTAQVSNAKVSAESITHLAKIQEQTRTLTTQLRLKINAYLNRVSLASKDLIIINDIIALEMLLSDWIGLVQFQLMPQLKTKRQDSTPL